MHQLLAWIVFIIIGLVIGWLLSRGSAKPVMAIVLGLVGGLVGGLVVYYVASGGTHPHHTIARYGSVIVSIVLALILGFLGRGGQKSLK
jgi:uncharacterized membrane protein YeaQ/YmgE (transglycosylase-associated protein family)